MPGLTVCSSQTPTPIGNALQSAAQAAGHEPEGLREGNPAVWAVADAAYPIATFDRGDLWAALEGVVYDAPSPEHALDALAPLLFDPSRRTALRHWVETTDGAFVVCAVHRPSSRWVLLTDGMGRLPLYRSEAHDCITRTYSLFYHLTPPPPLDRVGAAQQLHLEHPLGARTLVEGVDRLPPALCVRGGPNGTWEQAVFDSPLRRRHPVTGPSRDAAPSAESLAAAFVDAAERRAHVPDGPALALSGGLDSRAVACSLVRRGRPVHPMTLIRSDGRNRSDAQGAAALCDLLDLEGETVRLSPPGADDLRELLHLKGGLNALGVAFMLPFLRRVRERSATLLTGEGGLMLRDLRSSGAASTIDEGLQRLNATAKIPADVAASCVGLPPDALRDSLGDWLTTQTDSTPLDAHACVQLERLYRFTYEAEDRNRSFVWSSSPFFSLPFARLALRVPMRQKRNLRLYRAVLQAVHPDSLRVGYPDFMNVRLDSVAFPLYRAMRTLIRQVPLLRAALNRRRGKGATYTAEAPRLRCLRAHLDDAQRLLDASAVRRTLGGSPAASGRSHSRADHVAEHTVNALLTLTAVDRLHAGRPSLLVGTASMP